MDDFSRIRTSDAWAPRIRRTPAQSRTTLFHKYLITSNKRNTMVIELLLGTHALRCMGLAIITSIMVIELVPVDGPGADAAMDAQSLPLLRYCWKIDSTWLSAMLAPNGRARENI
jgi:hypothetical protein